jgi:hypothetical protein
VKTVKTPWISIVLMAIFLAGGSLALVVDWPRGPANLDWGVWLVVYFGYLYVVAASVFHVLTGK